MGAAERKTKAVILECENRNRINIELKYEEAHRIELAALNEKFEEELKYLHQMTEHNPKESAAD